MNYKENDKHIINRWTGESNDFQCIIDEKLNGLFYVYYKQKMLGLPVWGSWEDHALWFPSYKMARTYLTKEFCFEGRMKKVL